MNHERRDRDGEIFQNDLTNNEQASPSARELGSHEQKLDPNIDSQEDDRDNPAFARELRDTGHASGH
ncbi:MAG: hypothetical protein M3R51_02505 [Candidatus Eremiobacteraeota bacterium]|nr:hypothetical protein [Candidatus Eremiobacteraeota bacterium]